jgi:trk system potassium uptake protein
MKLVITGGKAEADFLISSLSENHKLIIINPDKEYARYLCDTHKVAVYCGDPCKEYILEGAEINNSDVLISLMQKDADNLAVCQLAREKFGIAKTVAIVTNPRNVELFRSFGVTEVVSSAYMVAQHLVQISTLNNLVTSFSLEDEKIVLTELDVTNGFHLMNVPICDMKLPPQVIIACIIRNGTMLVPNGQTAIHESDRLAILSPAETQNKLIELFAKEKRKS